MPHTPGPWEHTQDGRLPIRILARDDRWKGFEYTELAQVGGNINTGTGDFRESLANSDLMTAAPDLLAACKLFMQYDGENCQTGTTPYGDVKMAVEEAIRKAVNP